VVQVAAVLLQQGLAEQALLVKETTVVAVSLIAATMAQVAVEVALVQMEAMLRVAVLVAAVEALELHLAFLALL
jgi:hypothetical protein